MDSYIDKIKEISKRLLEEGKVEAVIGYRKGSVPAVNEPCMIKSSDDVKDLVWDTNCRLNLANYLAGRTEKKIGIIAKGCDSRNIVTLCIENKIKRDQLVIIGVPCKGMNDRNNPETLQENCKVCKYKNPVIYDELAAELVTEDKDVDRRGQPGG